MVRIAWAPERTMLQHVKENVTSKLHWVTANGRRIAVGKMDDNHLLNTVRKLRRAATEMQAEEYSVDDGDAINVIGQENYLAQRVKPYARMLAELKKRGLKDAARYIWPSRIRRQLPENDYDMEWDNESMWGNS